MKNLLIIVFYKINNKKIEEKINVQKTLTVALFNFVTFRHHVSLFAFATFGHFSCGRSCSEFLKLEERKR